MRMLITDAGILTPKLENSCEKILNAFSICSSPGRPPHNKNISIMHINEAFNMDVQAYFMVVYIDANNLFSLNDVDLGKNYAERTLAPN